jgi:DNA mismatch repair protein MutL
VSATLQATIGRRAWLAPQPVESGGTGARPAAEQLREAGAAAGGDWLFARSEELATGDEGGTAALSSTRPFRFADLHLLGQLHGTYLLLEAKDGLVLVDQHAAHERVLYERLRAAWLDSGVPRQPLLVAETLELAPAAQAALVEHAAWIEGLGYEVEAFGASAVVVRAIPALLVDRDPIGGLRGLAEQLQEEGTGEAVPRSGSRWLDAADRLFASMACHSARRAGEVLPADELRALADALDAIPWAATCPHGRPVAVPVSSTEIARRFGRS